MDADSDDDYDKVSVPEDFSDNDTESLGSAPRKTSSRSASTPSATQAKPYCREKRLNCPYDGCDKAFNRPTRLQEHIRSHTNERPFKCPYAPCDKDYLRESHLKHHIKSAHSEVRDYKCSYQGCDKAFATGQRLRVHEATHEAPNKYRCTGYAPCNQVFRKKETLQRHINSVHEQHVSFRCEEIDTRTGKVCKKSFGTTAKLAAHERNCHDPTRYSCETCVAHNDGIFANATVASILAIPKRAYFSTYAELQEHIAREHPPLCPLCPSIFHSKKELTQHLELDHDISDSKKKDREQHKCTHPGCDKIYTRIGNLNVHVRNVHEKRRFICGESEVTVDCAPPDAVITGCGRDFAHKSSLIDHIRSAHLGMDSSQKSKRKAKAEAEGPKKKKIRKDKGVRRVPAISGTTVEYDRFPFLDEDVDMGSDDDGSSIGELDGTMNMYG
jgi:general transcription factor IIIA